MLEYARSYRHPPDGLKKVTPRRYFFVEVDQTRHRASEAPEDKTRRLRRRNYSSFHSRKGPPSRSNFWCQLHDGSDLVIRVSGVDSNQSFSSNRQMPSGHSRWAVVDSRAEPPHWPSSARPSPRSSSSKGATFVTDNETPRSSSILTTSLLTFVGLAYLRYIRFNYAVDVVDAQCHRPHIIIVEGLLPRKLTLRLQPFLESLGKRLGIFRQPLVNGLCKPRRIHLFQVRAVRKTEYVQEVHVHLAAWGRATGRVIVGA